MARSAVKVTARGGTRGSPSAPARLHADDDAERLLRHWREAIPDDRIAHLVKDTTRALVRALQVRLARHDIPFGHWAFLRILWHEDGITQRELSLRAGVMEPTTSAALGLMARRGLVERRRLGRSVHVHLTQRGRALERRLVPLAVKVNEVALRRVPKADEAATRRTLIRMLESLAADAARGDP